LGIAASITVRPLERSDYTVWRQLWTAYLDFYETTVTDEVYETSFERLLSGDAHEFHGLIAANDGVPVGLTHYLFHRHGWKIQPVCYLQDLYTSPEARGLGVGRALIEGVYAAADEAGAPDVYWLTQDFNAPARKLYDRIAHVTPFIKYARA
jgi:GNAT superfamily N-acetyltransferase